MKILPRENSYFRIPIHVITGFLGSGKTTLLNQLLPQAGMQQTVVIVNEVGEIGIDHLLVQATTEDILLLEGGCLCCSVRSDLLKTLEELFERRQRQDLPPFQQILLETTGIADPVPILRTLSTDPWVAAHYRLEGVITTIDALYGDKQLDDFEESVKQAALAQHLVLTKIDLVEKATLDGLTQRLQRLNPTAVIYATNLLGPPLEATTLLKTHAYHHTHFQLQAEHWLKADAYLNLQPERQGQIFPPKSSEQTFRHDAYIRTFCIERNEPLHWLTLERWIQQLTRLRGQDLLRIKGIAYTYETELPVLIQGVQHTLQPPVTLDAWPTTERRTQIVFITRNIEKQVVEKLLETLIDSKTPVEVCQAALILLSQASPLQGEPPD